MTPHEYFRRLQSEQAENREILMRRNFKLDHGRAPMVLQQMDEALLSCRALLESRAAEGCVVEGHGDLKPEHVCFQNGIFIFDCLEFSDVLRQVDPVDEIAYLAMESERLGAPWLGPRLLRRIGEILGWSDLSRLYALHAARRALLRARLSLSHLLDATPRQPERWEPQATQMFGLAQRALDRLGEGRPRSRCLIRWRRRARPKPDVLPAAPPAASAVLAMPEPLVDGAAGVTLLDDAGQQRAERDDADRFRRRAFEERGGRRQAVGHPDFLDRRSGQERRAAVDEQAVRRDRDRFGGAAGEARLRRADRWFRPC